VSSCKSQCTGSAQAAVLHPAPASASMEALSNASLSEQISTVLSYKSDLYFLFSAKTDIKYHKLIL